MNRQVAELLDTIKYHNKRYRAGRPEVPDSVYDREVEMLRELDPDNSWFKHLEPAEVEVRRKVALPVPMKSLNKVKSVADLMRWADWAGLRDDDEIVIMPKFDGLSLLCNEKTGEAWSRGGTENEGQDCTEHLMTNGAVHDELFPYTYGEFVFSVDKWTSVFATKINPETQKPYCSPRNTAAGLLNRNEPSDDLKHVTFYRYGTDSKTVGTYKTFDVLLSDINATYKQERLMELKRLKNITENFLLELFTKWRKIYYIDGLVIYVNSISKWNKLGRKATSGNPNYAVAYKHPDFADSFETTVTNVSWKLSKSGAFKPVVCIEAVNTGDCRMDSPTGYNAGWIDKMKIAKGARVIVTRSGGVIPKILETIRPASDSSTFAMWEKMSCCPICGSPTSWDLKHIELCCVNPLCHGRRIAKTLYFFETVGMEYMGEETISRLYNEGYSSIKSILDITFDQLLDIPMIGEYMAKFILDNTQRIRSGVELATLMAASDLFPGVGKIKAQQLIDSFPPEMVDALYENRSVNEWRPERDELEKMNKTLQSFWSGISQFGNFITYNGLSISRPQKREINSNGKYKGMAVCFSGVRDPLLESAIIADGGSVVSGVSKKTTHLLVKDKEASTNKIEKAKQLKINIMTIQEFLNL